MEIANLHLAVRLRKKKGLWTPVRTAVKQHNANQWRTQESCSGGAVQQIQLRTEDRGNGDLGGGSPLVRGSGDSCNLVQEISFHIVKFS